jgi:hypothetical protein
VLKQWGVFCRDVVNRQAELKNGWVRYAANDMEFKGMHLESPVDVDEGVEARRGKMKEKMAKRKPGIGPTEPALL